MGPESVPLYCLAVMGANPARLWPGAPRVGEGEGAPPSLIRAAGGGSGAWGDGVGVLGFVISGRSPKELKTRHFGHAAKGDTSPFQADCRRGLLLAFPVRSPKELKTRQFGHAAKGDGRLSGQVTGEVCYSRMQSGGRRLDGSPLKAGCRRVVTHLPGQVTEKVDDLPLRAGAVRLMTHSRSGHRRG